MSFADLSLSSFNTDPKKGLEVADIYASDSLDKFLANPESADSSTIADMFPGVKPNRVVEVLNDPKLKAELDKTGQSVTQKVDDVDRALPGDIKTADVMDKHDIMSISDTVGRLSDMLSPDAYNSLSPSMLLSLLDTVPYFSEMADRFKGYGNTLFGDTLKLASGFFDDLKALPRGPFLSGLLDIGAELGYMASLAIELVKNSPLGTAVSSVMSLLQNTGSAAAGLVDELYKFVLKHAALIGDIALVTAIVLAIRDRLQSHEKKKTVRQILTSYSYDRSKPRSERTAMAKELVDLLLSLDPNWNTTDRDGETVGNFAQFRFATFDALDILKYDKRTEVQAIIYMDKQYRAEPYKVIAREQYDYVHL